MPTVDDDLSQIERDIRTLKIEYEQFFGGGRPRPPADTQWRVDTTMRRCNERVGDLNFAQRFRLNNLAQTYAKYQDMWRKKLMQKETGIQQHHFGAAAKAVEAERARKAALLQPAEPPKPVTQVPLDLRAAEAAGRAAAVQQVSASFALSLSDPDHEKEKVYTLYEKLIEARTETGERDGAPNLKAFEKFVRQKTKELKDKGGRQVEYTVNIENGRVKLKARISM
ncbi:MAG TPA: MXAN_5187 C-terminal domain-containing protein [Candidatus Acidoferrales bacterium]|nr:MXAN_5187 C-terminal domain-containing protein [Candidatus Acidoferrales bacterium]